MTKKNQSHRSIFEGVREERRIPGTNAWADDCISVFRTQSTGVETENLDQRVKRKTRKKF